jgi:adenine-specific DNA-methyltransferase
MTDNKYLQSQIITYMGNKRKLIPILSAILNDIVKCLNKRHICCADAFSGSGIVSRLLKTVSSELFVNDIAGYSYTLNSCYLSTPTKKERETIEKYIEEANEFAHSENSICEPYIQKHWAPKSTSTIKKTDRVYFTKNNGILIDKYRYFIDQHCPEKYKKYLLAQLIVKASIHNNTSGQFSAFYKDNGVGKYGGKYENDLQRITKNIKLDIPVMSLHKCKITVSQLDVLEWLNTIPEVDVMYIDPPYNKHPYSIYYFMLDIIHDWDMKQTIPETNRGQPKTWTKSHYNSLNHASKAFEILIENAKSRYLIVSYNNKGIIPLTQLKSILSKKGKITEYIINHKTYNRMKGIANYKRKKNDNESINEYIWVIQTFQK